MDYIDIFIKNNYINLKQIAESGQCFRWKKMCPGRYFVISDGRAACFFQEKTGIRILCREKDEEYFSTLFHEFIHSTGSPQRLGRFGMEQVEYF